MCVFLLFCFFFFTGSVNLFWAHHGGFCFGLLCYIRSPQIRLPVAPAAVDSILCAVTVSGLLIMCVDDKDTDFW